MKIGVVGGGVVGQAVARTYLEHAEVKVYDVVKTKATHSFDETLQCDLVFVCLPTPQKAAALTVELSALETFFRAVRGKHTNLVLRSTVPIGLTGALRAKYNLPNLVHSPEFLTARCANTDAQIPARNIIGGPTCDCRTVLFDLYDRRFPGVPIFVMESDESEAVKLIVNGFFAVKIAFFNEIRSLTDERGMNWESVIAGVLSDGRISHSHTKVPGPDGFGFSGACLPKDLANLISCIESDDQAAALVTRAAYVRNIADRTRR